MICCMAVVSCGQAPTAMGPGQYAVMTVSTTDREIPSNYSATIRGRQDIDIYPQVSGTIFQLCVTEGQRVSNGQTLFIIDQVPYKAALQTAEANVAAAEASVATAQLTYDSKKELFARNVVSQFDLSTAENNLLTAKAQLAQAEAQRVNAANNLSYTVVKSPANGVVGTLPYRVGALVSASIPQPLTTVSDNSVMYVYFSMTENQLLDMTRKYGSIEQTLKQLPDVQLRLNDGSIYDKTGRIESISGVIDPSTGTVSLRAAFPNEGGLLHSGGAGNIILPTLYKDCIAIPQSATFELQDKVFVYKLVDGKASSAPVQVASISDGKEYIVLSGLAAGDVIITEGVGLLREGTPVVPKGQSAAQPAAEQAERRIRRQRDEQVAGNAQHDAAAHEALEPDARAELAVDGAGGPHEGGEEHRPGQIAQRFGDVQFRFGKRGSPLTDRLLAAAGADHKHQQQPEGAAFDKPGQRRAAAAFLDQRIDGHFGEQQAVERRYHGPQQRQHPPVRDAEHRKEHAGEQHHAHLPPAVERMQQAHGGLFVIGGAGFDDRADQHLQQPAADGVDHHGNDQPGKRAGQQLRQHGQRDEPGSRKDVRQHHRRAVADAVDEARAEQVDRKLHAEVEGDEQRDARKRDAVALLEGQKQQRRKVVDDGLHDIGDKAGVHRPFRTHLHAQFLAFRGRKTPRSHHSAGVS